MTARLFRAAALAAALAAPGSAGLSGHALADEASVTTYEIEAPFADVRQDLSDAIINRGYVIDYNARIGDMLARTAADVGATKQIYADAETLQFCSAVLSRKAMEADPANIAYCPYALFVYAEAETPGTVTVGFRPLAETGSEASRAAVHEVNMLLDEIAREAAGAE